VHLRIRRPHDVAEEDLSVKSVQEVGDRGARSRLGGLGEVDARSWGIEGEELNFVAAFVQSGEAKISWAERHTRAVRLICSVQINGDCAFVQIKADTNSVA
jgi:hypothetical protein